MMGTVRLLGRSALALAMALSLIASSGEAAAEPEKTYVVKRGEVWDWADVLAQAEHYRGRRGLGLEGLIARFNDADPNARPPRGATIRLPKLPELVGEGKLLESEDSAAAARAALAARKIALEFGRGTCAGDDWNRPGREDREKMQEVLRELRQAGKSVASVSRRAAVHLRRARRFLAEFLERLPKHSAGARAHFCKGHISVLNRTGRALEALYVAAQKAE